METRTLTQITEGADPQLLDHADAGPHPALTYNANVNEKVTAEPNKVGTGILTNKTPAPWRRKAVDR